MWMSGLLFVLLGMDVYYSEAGLLGIDINFQSSQISPGTDVNSQSSSSTQGTDDYSQSSPSTQDLRKTFVMMQFLSSVNMTDPAVSNTILNQLKTALTSKGLSDFTLTWTKLPLKVKPKIKLVGPCV